ncbi:HARBI1 [Mytilus edulis]|uniref:HARBI1 n=1 Tax=Mytilus edulis TaxID=6550 RepID=A0A8S3RAA7_MYTED|nr:HARBI1 [Mytilus edulis]
MNVVKRGLYRIAKVPNVIGAVDGTLIPIIAPKENEPAYVCRKGYYSLNIQAVVDHEMRFTNLVAKFPGSVHDSYIFSNSELGYFFEENNVDGWLLGDSGYGLKKCLHKTGGCLPFTPDKSAIVVTAVFKLHNKCIDDKLPLPDFTDDFIDNGDNHIRDIAPANVQTLREHIIQKFA